MKAQVLDFKPKDLRGQKKRIYYYAKKTNEKKRLYDELYRDLSYVVRKDDATKYISVTAQKLLSNLAQMILRNKQGAEFVDHNFLSGITGCRSSRQNINLLKQISEIIEFQYHNCITFQGNRRGYGYLIKFTEDGEQRYKNPEKFYSINSRFKPEIISDPEGNKLPSEWKKISTSIKEELEELPSGVQSNSHPKEKIKNKNKDDENETLFLAASGSMAEPAAKNEFLPENPPTLEPSSSEALTPYESINPPTEKQVLVPPLMTAEEEAARYRDHRHRNPSTAIGEASISSFIGQISENLTKQVDGTDAYQKGGEFQPEVEDSPSSSPPETLIPISIKEEKPIKTETYDREWILISRDFGEWLGEYEYFAAWVSKKPKIIQDCNEKTMTIKLPSEFFKMYVEEKYMPKLSELAAKYGDYQIKLEVKE